MYKAKHTIHKCDFFVKNLLTLSVMMNYNFKKCYRTREDVMRKLKYLICLFLFVLCFGPSLHSSAKTVTNPTTVNLSVGKKYTAYDVTGDRKADTFQLKYIEGGVSDGESCHRGVKVYVGGKKVASIKGKEGYFTLYAKLYTLKNGKVFLYLYGEAFNMYCDFAGLYQYKSGTFKKVADLYGLLSKYGISYGGTVYKVSGNSLTVRFNLDSYSTGFSCIEYVYTWKSGKLTQASYGTYKYAYTITSSGTKNTTRLRVNKRLTAYKSAGSSKKAFTLKKGNYVTISRCQIVKGNMYIRVKYNSKYGWVKALTKYPVTYTTDNNQFASVGHVN